jgi:hypothetical protein
MWTSYGVDAARRGHHAILVDGPGQQSALFRQQLHFIPDWERVVTPTVDWLVSRSDVADERIAVLGCSQGGYWAARAAAFEPRLAACVADPGVLDCFAPWKQHLPPPLEQLLESGDQHGFDAAMEEGLGASPELRQTWLFRSRPYGLSSAFAVFRAAAQYTLEGVAERIRCPTAVCDPEGEQFWPGQAKELYDKLTCPKALLSFSAAEGADRHCEPLGNVVRNQRIFDWLDGILEP